MKKAVNRSATILALIVVASLAAGCGGPQPPPPRAPVAPATDETTPPPRADAPTVRLTASPTRIERNQQVTLNWETSGATSVVIDNGVGNVAENGSLVVTPRESVTYTAVAKGRGGEARSSARVTVVEPTRAAPLTTDQGEIERLIAEGAFGPVFFAYDKADLTAEAQAVLRENAGYLRQFPDSQVVIEGHCDERGSEEYNLALGDRRARAAYDYLIQLGVSANRMRTISYGEERPFDTGTTEAAYAKNRRAQFRGAR